MAFLLYTYAMSDLSLDTRDKARVADFIADNAEFASPKERSYAEDLVVAYQEGDKVSSEKLANACRKLAIAAWPARFALEKYFTREGASDEWQRVVSAVRPSTAHLLKRFRQGTTAETLDEVLSHEDSDAAFKEGERLEIDEVRKHVRLDHWRERRKSIEPYVKEGKLRLDAYAEALGKLRELATSLPQGLQDEAFSKLAHYEDRILYRGEAVPMEILEHEVAYYTEQKEISPEE